MAKARGNPVSRFGRSIRKSPPAKFFARNELGRTILADAIVAAGGALIAAMFRHRKKLGAPLRAALTARAARAPALAISGALHAGARTGQTAAEMLGIAPPSRSKSASRARAKKRATRA